MLYQGRAIGVIRLYTEQRRRFSQAQVNLLRAIAQLLAVEIENAQLDEQQREGQRVQRQLAIAADVQRRMLPAQMPNVPGLDIAARYVPSLELSGDFYDFIEMEGRLGVCVGDVVGKGVAASLLMASVRASLRAYAQDMYDLDEIMSRVNIAMTCDTLDKEFATLFYGVYDPGTRRLAYANAGHEPPLLARDGQIIPLDVGGMIVGVDPTQKYKKALVTLSAGDMLVIYTDGLMDALNFDQKRFGRQRVYEALQQAVSMPAQNAVHHLLWEMRRFVGLNRASDDTTIVVMKIV
jgi:sigma-B regulation protein RsbU (phosphoserine phosphatase)